MKCINGVRASGHVTMSTSIYKALHFRFLENEVQCFAYGCLWMWTGSHDHVHKPHYAWVGWSTNMTVQRAGIEPSNIRSPEHVSEPHFWTPTSLDT